MAEWIQAFQSQLLVAFLLLHAIVEIETANVSCETSRHHCSSNSRCLAQTHGLTCQCEHGFSGPTCTSWHGNSDQCQGNEYIVVLPGYSVYAEKRTAEQATAECSAYGLYLPPSKSVCLLSALAVFARKGNHERFFMNSGRTLVDYQGETSIPGPLDKGRFVCSADISKKKIVSTICNDVMYYVPRMASSTLPSATQWTTANTACQGGLVVASELSPCGISFAKKVNTLFGVDASEIWSSQRDVSIDLAAFVGETPTTQSNSSSSVTFLPLCQESWCSQPTLLNGQATVTSRIAQFKCSSGFRLVGLPFSVCANQTWMFKRACIPLKQGELPGPKISLHLYPPASHQDVCKGTSHGCHEDALCLNTHSTFTCTCLPGFTGNGRHCQACTPPQLETRPAGYAGIAKNGTTICQKGWLPETSKPATCSESGILQPTKCISASQYHRNNGYVVVPTIPFSRDLLRMSHYNATKHCIDTYGYEARLLDFQNAFEVETLSVVLGKLGLGAAATNDLFIWSRQSDVLSLDGHAFGTHYAFEVKGSQLGRSQARSSLEELPFACLARICNNAVRVDSTGVLNINEDGSAQCLPGHTLKNPKRAYCHQGNWVNFPICELNPPAQGYLPGCTPAPDIANRYAKVYRDGSVVCKAGHWNRRHHGNPAYCNHAAGNLWWNIDQCAPTIKWDHGSQSFDLYIPHQSKVVHNDFDGASRVCSNANGALLSLGLFTLMDRAMSLASTFQWEAPWSMYYAQTNYIWYKHQKIWLDTWAPDLTRKIVCTVVCKVDSSQLTLPGYVSIDSKTLDVVCQTGYHLHIPRKTLTCGADGLWKNLPSCIRDTV
eukprot:scpid44625/ scgid12418/ 